MTLSELIRAIEGGSFPPPDFGVTLLAPASDREAAVLGFTAHIVVAAAVDPGWLADRLPPGDPAEAFNPPFLGALAGALNRRVNCVDLLALAPPAPGPPPVPLTEATDADHPRVRRARRYRDEVRVWTTEGGLVLIGRGLAGRWEVAVEVEPAYRGHGLGRRLAVAARHLVPGDRPVWAQVASGNAASVRAFLAAGFAPVGAEALLVRREPPPGANASRPRGRPRGEAEGGGRAWPRGRRRPVPGGRPAPAED